MENKKLDALEVVAKANFPEVRRKVANEMGPCSNQTFIEASFDGTLVILDMGQKFYRHTIERRWHEGALNPLVCSPIQNTLFEDMGSKHA